MQEAAPGFGESSSAAPAIAAVLSLHPYNDLKQVETELIHAQQR
jgi:hypothetical protein